MSPELTRVLILTVAAAAAGLLASLAFRAIAFRSGAVCHPRGDRWSRKAVPLLGGPAIVLATAVGLAFIPDLPMPIWVLMAGATTLSAVGLVDDLFPLTPYTKLAAQLAAAAAVTAFGLRFPLTGIPVLDIVVTMLWLVGLSNAFNLLDNMDGLAAGIAAITALVKLVIFAMEGDWTAACATGVFAGACVGFLALNFNPARIFMGDSGSMFLGFFVAGLSTIGTVPDSRATMSVLIGPVAVMLVPIFDTVLVTVMRLVAGRPISQGGRDHLSHRLVTAGLTERRAVLTLYGLAVVSGVVGVATRHADRPTGFTLLVALGIAMLLLGVTLARIRIYPADSGEPMGGFRLHHPPALSFVRQFATAAIDGVLVLAAFYMASTARPDTQLSAAATVQALPLVISAKMFALAIFRVNNRVWRHTNSRDLLAIAQASIVGSAAALILVASVHGLSPAVGQIFLLDWILLTSFLTASRLFLRMLADVLKPVPEGARRVLIYGAGEGGVLLLQEIRNNVTLGRLAVGFADDNALMQRTRVQGLPVMGGVEDLAEALRIQRIEEVILATTKLPPGRLDRVKEICGVADVRFSRFRMSIENLSGRAQIRQIS